MIEWFKENDITQYNHQPIYLNNLRGYVLPHAGTTYTGHILAHTLRFRPSREILEKIDTIVIFYLPSTRDPDDGGEYHEYSVPYNALITVPEFSDMEFIGYNVIDTDPSTINQINSLDKAHTLFVVSADFSHNLPLQEAIKRENCAAHALMHRSFSPECTSVIDSSTSFQRLYSLIPDNWQFQWVGRTRSPGELGVGYCSFLLRTAPDLTKTPPNGFFVTAYDEEMNSRECLGNTTSWSRQLEKALVNDVLTKASTTSRLTGGELLNVPVTNYTVTYLYDERKSRRHFIRGWHGMKTDALYLPDVFLENTYDNGSWIKPQDIKWPKGNKFRFKQTLNKLKSKVRQFMNRSVGAKRRRRNRRNKKNVTKTIYKNRPHLFYSEVRHHMRSS